ncbi:MULTISPECIES: hypothetical protein [Lactobacillus]|uniref:hypothetical protein n=1 Tax=Lactobacillus TaxID=1578 RepID=UPI0018DC5FEF|nr:MULTISPECIES: hypothetical protein [unclassified Lactobacillus]MBI0121635.1 hypothetical protein [Lactobacillus sp. M0398]MBI0122314.1 hypothetical protein [Lactobacillus sp. W8174]MBI0134622.1 hypothetical protein [Lactobacillus sp. W8173]MCT6888458.1 hypothetical protein [Lactobacillus sp.]
MGFWIMILALVSGTVLIFLSFASQFSKLTKRISFVAGCILIASAIFLATPSGAAFVMDIT